MVEVMNDIEFLEMLAKEYDEQHDFYLSFEIRSDPVAARKCRERADRLRKMVNPRYVRSL